MIGLFMMGLLIISIVGVVAFTSKSLFSNRAIFVSHFRESVNGLAEGSKVKCQGVPVGEVTDLQLLIDLENETFQVPVYYDIDLDRLQLVLASSLELGDYAALQQHIDKGLRAQLQYESIVTGQMYIELRYIGTDEVSQAFIDELQPNEIPTEFSPFASLSSEASGLVSNLRSMNVNAISENLTAFLLKASQKIDELDLDGLSASMLETSASIRDLAASEDIQNAISTIPQASEQFTQTMADVQQLTRRLDGAIEQLTTNLDASSAELNTTLQAMRESMDRANSMLTTDGGIGYHLQEALTSMTEAAEALQLLANTLEQNPSMFIRGKDEPGQ